LKYKSIRLAAKKAHSFPLAVSIAVNRYLSFLEELDHLASLARSVERMGEIQGIYPLFVWTADQAHAVQEIKTKLEP
jgi:hypothetical protein